MSDLIANRLIKHPGGWFAALSAQCSMSATKLSVTPKPITFLRASRQEAGFVSGSVFFEVPVEGAGFMNMDATLPIAGAVLQLAL